MILVAGLTPAWQQIMCFDHLRGGEVNRARQVQWCASGKVLNVAVALAHLEVECTVLSPLGGLSGQEIDREFATLPVRRRWIAVERPTRVCTTILQEQPPQTTELVENAGSLSRDELARFAAAFCELSATAQLVVFSGSLPAGTPPEYFAELVAPVACPLVLDVRGPELLAALAARPLVVKPNREELARTLGVDLRDDAALVAAMRQLNDRGAQWVVISAGSHATWVSSVDRCYQFRPPQVPVLNPIGSGDCLCAGIAAGTAQGLAPLEAIRLGMAAASENVTQWLPARIALPAVRQRMGAIAIEDVGV